MQLTCGCRFSRLPTQFVPDFMNPRKQKYRLAGKIALESVSNPEFRTSPITFFPIRDLQNFNCKDSTRVQWNLIIAPGPTAFGSDSMAQKQSRCGGHPQQKERINHRPDCEERMPWRTPGLLFHLPLLTVPDFYHPESTVFRKSKTKSLPLRKTSVNVVGDKRRATFDEKIRCALEIRRGKRLRPQPSPTNDLPLRQWPHLPPCPEREDHERRQTSFESPRK